MSHYDPSVKPSLAQLLMAFIFPPHMLYVLKDGAPKKVKTVDEVGLFMMQNDPFLVRHYVPEADVTVVVLFLCMNMDQVHFPKLFAVDCLLPDNGVAHVGKYRTEREARHWARRAAERLANGKARVVPEGQLSA